MQFSSKTIYGPTRDTPDRLCVNQLEDTQFSLLPYNELFSAQCMVQKRRVGNSLFCSLLFCSLLFPSFALRSFALHSFALRSFALRSFILRSFALHSFAPCFFALRSFALCSFAFCSSFLFSESNYLLMKEQLALFKSELYSFLKRKLQIHSFHPDFPLFMPKTKERIALVALYKKSVIPFF